MKKSNIIILIIIFFGSTSIFIATYLATATIPNLDDKISSIHDDIEKLNARRERGVIFSLNYRQNEIKKRIDIFELNSLILHNAGEEEQVELKNRILNHNIDLTRAWTTLWEYSDSNVVLDRVNKEIETIVNESGTFEEIKGKLNILLLESIEIANNNLLKIQNERNKLKEEKVEYKNHRCSVFITFIWFQIIGLVFLSISTFIEKIQWKLLK